ncbi:hypothetical protein AB0M45_10650 [Nocardia sp. NPDC051787]|uniref:hypothetical protein n=1 Tax=Nocardia sp. NPDC051787 TaxID=3155415 RepID=UPI0034464B1F
MAVQGYYNHYDDPDDEFGVDEPLDRRRDTFPAGSTRDPAVPPPGPEMTPGPSKSARRSTDDYPDRSEHTHEVASNPYQKSSLVEVELRLDRLPTAIKLSRTWKDAFDPSQYGKSIMDAYRYSVFETAIRIAESGSIPPATLPTLRDVAPLLLRTRTYDEFRDLYHQLFHLETYTVYGPGYNEYDEPGIVVTATRSKLVSLTIDPSWAMTIDSNYIAQDIVECCNRVRAKKTEVVRDIYLDQESNRELAARLNRHEKILLGNVF